MGCRWDFRAFWLVQELLDQEPDFDLLMIPSQTAGTFDVKDMNGKSVFVKAKGGNFPDPSIDLPQWIVESDAIDDDRTQHIDNDVDLGKLSQVIEMRGEEMMPCVDIAYCTEHRQRALYLAQECLRTFSEEITSLSLRSTVNVADLQVAVIKKAFDGGRSIVWQNGFPETKVLKQKIRNELAPTKSLGHSDHHSKQDDGNEIQNSDADMDDEEAADARQFFGVA